MGSPFDTLPTTIPEGHIEQPQSNEEVLAKTLKAWLEVNAGKTVSAKLFSDTEYTKIGATNGETSVQSLATLILTTLPEDRLVPGAQITISFHTEGEEPGQGYGPDFEIK